MNQIFKRIDQRINQRINQRILAGFLCIALLAGVFGCTGPAVASNANAAETAKGRYMEQVINLPLPEGATEQYVIGLDALENGAAGLHRSRARAKAALVSGA